MRFAYADPPYLGCGRLYAGRHPEALAWDDPEQHRALIERLCDEYPSLPGACSKLVIPSDYWNGPDREDYQCAVCTAKYGPLHPSPFAAPWTVHVVAPAPTEPDRRG